MCYFVKFASIYSRYPDIRTLTFDISDATHEIHNASRVYEMPKRHMLEIRR